MRLSPPERFPAKRELVRRKKARQIKGLERRSDSIGANSAPGASLLFACLAVLAGCHGKPPPPPPPKVGVVTAVVQSVPLHKDMVGRLSSYLSANVTARVSGVLVSRNYKEGSEVRRGQVLFEIDPTYYRSQLNLASGTLASDKAVYIDNRITAERLHKLLPSGFVSQQNVDDADAAERNYAGKVAADQAAVDSARVNLGYTKVTSPIAGISGQQQVTVGAVVGSSTTDTGSSGTLLTTVDQVDTLYVNFTISAADLVTLRQAQSQGGVALSGQNKTTAQVLLPNGSRYDQLGVLDFSDVAVNATTGAVNLRALIPNPQHSLLPGMYVTLVVDFGRQNNVVLVPQQALLRDTVGPYVLTLDHAGKVVRKDVSSTDSLGADAIVTSGLTAGDQVIVTDLQGVQAGAKATAIPWRGSATAGSASASAPAQAGPPARAKQ